VKTFSDYRLLLCAFAWEKVLYKADDGLFAEGFNQKTKARTVFAFL
jgi:hypothetical protein